MSRKRGCLSADRPRQRRALRVTADRIADMAREWPSVAIDFNRLVAAHLARRLARTNCLLQNLEA